MANITFSYKNLVEFATAITESSGTSDTTNFGTAKLIDFSLSTSFRSNTDSGTTTVTVNFGSSVYIDTCIVVHNITSIGTVIIKAGNTTSVSNATWGLSSNSGTSVRYNGSQIGYQYWQLNLAGTVSGYHEVFELFLGKRVELNENPVYPFSYGEIDDFSQSVTQGGQKYVYHNFTRKYWDLDFQAISKTTYDQLISMKRYTKTNYKPLWFCLDKDQSIDTYYVRTKSFTWKDLISNIYDVTVSLEQEL